MSETTKAPKTKKVKVMMGALLRTQFCRVIEVPEDMDDEKVLELLNEDLDGSEYEPDPHFWERGDEYVTVPDDDEKATCQLVDGRMKGIAPPLVEEDGS